MQDVQAAETASEAGVPGWLLASVALIFGAFMTNLDTSIVTVAIPDMQSVFGVTTDQVVWVVTAYLLALGVSAPVSGWLADRGGYRRLYLISLGVFTAGSLAAAMSPSLGLLIGARVVQALGAGLMLPATTALIFRMVPRNHLGVVMGFRGVAMLVAPALGPLLGGYIVTYIGWRWIFTINVPIGVLGMMFGAATIPEILRRHRTAFDMAGFAFSAVGLTALLLALSEGRRLGWFSPWIVALFDVGALALVAFVWTELRAPEPMIDLRLLRTVAFRASIVYSALMDVVIFAGLFFIPVFFELVRGQSALRAGLVLTGPALAAAVVMPLAGWVYDHAGAVLPTIVGTGLMMAGGWLLHDITLSTPAGTVQAWLAIWGIGMGLGMMPALTAGMAAVPALDVGRATALRNATTRVTTAMGLAALTTLLETGMAHQSAAIANRITAASPSGVQILALLHRYAVQPAEGLAMRSHLADRIQALGFTRSLDEIFGALTVLTLVGFLAGARLGPRGQRAAATGDHPIRRASSPL